MADAKNLLDFLECGVGMFFDVRLEFFGVELAPMSPASFRGQRAFFGGDQIPVNGTPRQVKPPGGLGFGAAALNEFHHPFPQVQRIGFHARKPVSLCPNVNMKCYGGWQSGEKTLWNLLQHHASCRKENIAVLGHAAVFFAGSGFCLAGLIGLILLI